MRKLLNFLRVGSLCLVSLMLVAAAGDDDKAKKLTIADVMQQAHKAPLLKSVAKGTASDEEKQKLLELYVAMAELDAPVGDKASWNEKTSLLVEAAKAAVAGEAEAGNLLTKASSCKACHTAHKPG